ncbi:GDSL esterase/lipase At4g16230-like [Chenopodium quinoa]|uniref:GDSL esterase/lipase At4g16230-like n=1 Tax=Chenopodium quinoa TaxID=63459 RepID=UPI000B770B22|nr:GDSL esterase/lipase At4g16230-like [Chenopodium quinoa]
MLSNCNCISNGQNPKIATFVFGDSLVDVGNNNYLVSLSRADYPPNGIDFGMPTGRFCNGKTMLDFLAEEFGTIASPPYLAPYAKGPLILQGINYASAGSGILNETGQIYIGRINFDAQLDNFANTKNDMISLIGAAATDELVNKALFVVNFGSNDFIANYFVPDYIKEFWQPKTPPPQDFIDSMISKLRLQLTRLFNMGARKIVVPNVGPIGCTPAEREFNGKLKNSDCVAFPNQIAQSYNIQLKNLLTELSNNLKGSIFLYANAYRIFNDIVTNYKSYGFEVPDTACCTEGGRYGQIIVCNPTSTYCKDRTKYVFWDLFHPTEATNSIIIKRLLDGDINDISPMNLRQLLSL